MFAEMLCLFLWSLGCASLMHDKSIRLMPTAEVTAGRRVIRCSVSTDNGSLGGGRFLSGTFLRKKVGSWLGNPGFYWWVGRMFLFFFHQIKWKTDCIFFMAA